MFLRFRILSHPSGCGAANSFFQNNIVAPLNDFASPKDAEPFMVKYTTTYTLKDWRAPGRVRRKTAPTGSADPNA